MKRLFTGIPVAAEQVPRLVEEVDVLRVGHPELRWSDRAGWHVTLQFYGMVDAEQEALLRDKLRTVEGAALEVRVEGLGKFERAGVLWVGVALSEQLVALQSTVVAVGKECGFAAEDRPYRPHVTLARRKGRGGRWDVGRREVMDAEREFGEFLAREFALYESVTGPGGSRYEVIDRFPLRG